MENLNPKEPAAYYRHFKGGEYEFIGFAKHSETEEDLVIYRSLSNNQIWARPRAMFFDEVESDGKKQLRFTPFEKN
jgi:hypothetical protein